MKGSRTYRERLIVSAADLVTTVTVGMAVLLVGLAGGLGPALTAIRLDPWSVLRSD